MSRTPTYDPDAILRDWLAQLLRQQPTLTPERLVQAAATHFNRPRWPQQNPATHRAWRLAREVIAQTIPPREGK